MSEDLKRSLPEDASGDLPTEGPCLKWHVSAVTGFAPSSARTVKPLEENFLTSFHRIYQLWSRGALERGNPES